MPDSLYVPPKPRRFQIPLRALLIVVLAYGALWLITLKGGGKELAQHYAEIYKIDNPEISGGTLVITHKNVSIEIDKESRKTVRMSSDQYRGHAISPAPFVVFWRWEVKGAEDSDFKSNGKDADQHIWIFGYRKELNNPNPPYGWYDRFGSPVLNQGGP